MQKKRLLIGLLERHEACHRIEKALVKWGIPREAVNSELTGAVYNISSA
jgi:hypothetical protein